MQPMPLEQDRTEWQSAAMSWIETFAASGLPFSAADLRGKVPEPDHSSQWGALFRVAKRRGLLIEEASVPSRTRSRRYGRSILWRGNPDAEPTKERDCA